MNPPKNPRGDVLSMGADDARDDAPTQFHFAALLPRTAVQPSPPARAVDVPIEVELDVAVDPAGELDLVIDGGADLEPRAGTAGHGVDALAPPRGADPQVRRAGPFLFVSGTSARRPDGSVEGAEVDASGTTHLDIRAQTRAVITHIQAILRAAGADLSDLVEWTTYLVDMNDQAGYNEVYAEWFSRDSGPARTTVAVHQLPHPHLRIEVRAVAWLSR